MSTRRALIPEADLRRWAKVSREEGVSIRGRIDSSGGVTIHIGPMAAAVGGDDVDLDARLAQFGRS